MIALILLAVTLALCLLNTYLVRADRVALTVTVLVAITTAITLALVATSGHPYGTHLAGGARN